MPSYFVLLQVGLTASGCASAVRAAVTALPDVQSVGTSVEKQKVNIIVANDITFDQMKLVIQKTGKQVKGGRIIMGERVTEMPVQGAVLN